MKTVKSNLLVRRVMRGYTQEQLCKELFKRYSDNCSQCDISAYENGYRLPNSLRLLYMADVLKCSVEDIFMLVDTAEEKEIEQE